MLDIRETNEVLKSLFYAGEKPPHMWWAEFEKHLTRAFNAYVKREGRIVHSDSMKIRMLLDKIRADFLTPNKAQLEIELSRILMTITYDQLLAGLFRNMVNQSIRHRWERPRIGYVAQSMECHPIVVEVVVVTVAEEEVLDAVGDEAVTVLHGKPDRTVE